MTYDLDTEEGLENSKAWLENMINMLKDGGVWAIPRSQAFYTFNKKTKVAHRAIPDPATDFVLTKMGWKLV